MTGEKKTEEVRFPIDADTLGRLKRIAHAHGYNNHSALVREWMLREIDREFHAAKLILGMDEGAGIDRNGSEIVGGRRK